VSGATSRVFFAILSCAVVSSAQAQDEGARTWLPVPARTGQLSVDGLITRGNQSLDPGVVVPQSNVNVNVGVLRYAQSFGARNHLFTGFGALPFGEVSGSLPVSNGTLQARSMGIGDVVFGFLFGLSGMPALTDSAYEEFHPGMALGVLVKAYPPTGEYADSEFVNLGSNRWAFVLGAPMSYAVAPSLRDAALLTFELVPTVRLYSTNRSSFNAIVTGQAPIWNIEGHVTRNLDPAFWISLDGSARYGGATTADGGGNDNQQQAVALGASAGIALSGRGSIRLSYGGVVWHNDTGPHGFLIRATAGLLL
jgi:hypothetical protein